MKITGRNFRIMLKEVRERRNLIKEQLAQRVGKKRSYIFRVETDYRNKIKLQTLLKIIEN